jgi:hypothetical protein
MLPSPALDEETHPALAVTALEVLTGAGYSQ